MAVKGTLDIMRTVIWWFYCILNAIYNISAVDGLNSEQQAMYEVARNFATNELEPGMKIWDEEVCKGWCS